MSLSMNYCLQEEKLRSTHSRSTESDFNDLSNQNITGKSTEARSKGLLSTLSASYDDNSSILDDILTLDTHLTRMIAVCAQPKTHFQKFLRLFCYLLEVTGHGVTWFVVCGLIAVGYCCTRYEIFWIYLFNMFTILVADIIVVAPIKLYFQRPRPALNRGYIPLSVSSVDKYAFPSGHTSRCVALAVLFCYMSPFHIGTNLFCTWACFVSLSRILIGRHHILDVLVGILAGVAVFEMTKLTILIL